MFRVFGLSSDCSFPVAAARSRRHFTTYRSKPSLLFTLAIGFRQHPFVNRTRIESDEISGHEERDVIAIDPAVDRALTDLEALGQLRNGQIAWFTFSSRFR